MYGVCVSFVVFTDCESCTRPISTNPGIYESGRVWANAWDVFRRTPPRGGRGRRSCCGFRGVFWVRRDFVFFRFFFFERTRPAASMRPPCLIYLSTSNCRPYVSTRRRLCDDTAVGRIKENIYLVFVAEQTRGISADKEKRNILQHRR